MDFSTASNYSNKIYQNPIDLSTDEVFKPQSYNLERDLNSSNEDSSSSPSSSTSNVDKSKFLNFYQPTTLSNSAVAVQPNSSELLHKSKYFQNLTPNEQNSMQNHIMQLYMASPGPDPQTPMQNSPINFSRPLSSTSSQGSASLPNSPNSVGNGVSSNR